MRDLVEKGLRRLRAGPAEGAATAREPSLASFVDRLLRLLADLAPDAEAEHTTAFLAQLENYRRRLSTADDSAGLLRVTEACLGVCESYLSGSRRYISAREAELTELIAILRDAIASMSGGSSSFNDELLHRSQRITALVELDDIRELRRQLTSEVRTLRDAVQEKQRRDDETYASLNMRVEVLQMKLVRAEEEAALDPLTRVANRRSFDRALRRMTAAARQSKAPLTLAMLDVDSFKRINDTHGHPIGDRVLLCAAMWLGKSLRHSDFIARYGGEEFAVILYDATLSEVQPRLAAVLAEISTRTFEYDAGDTSRSVQFTMCCGAAELTSGESDEDLLKRADDALYEAKRTGRGTLVVKKRGLINR
jgi:diguanylate cyclase